MELFHKKTKDSVANDDAIDKISRLPDDILHHILSRLDYFEGKETSKLSRRWRYVWATMPYLDFNILKFFSDQGILVCDETLIEKTKDFINWILISLVSTKLVRFSLCSSFIFSKEIILRWIHAVSRRNVQELDLNFDPKEAFELPHCLVTSESLRVLKLKLCGHVIQLPCYSGFTQLRDLSLDEVKLESEDLTRKVISRCPVLERLKLSKCIVRPMKVLDISSASLKHLTIFSLDDVTDSNGGYNEIEIKLSCPKLVIFDYSAPIARNYILNNLESLEMVSIYSLSVRLNEEEVGKLMCQVLKKFASTIELKFDLVIILCISSVFERFKCLNVTFHQLKSLTLWLAIDGFYLRVMIFLLKYSPNLETLILIIEESVIMSEDEWELLDNEIACLASKLKFVRLIEFNGDENEMNFVKFLLEHGLVLEKVVIVLNEFAEISTSIVADTIFEFPKSSPNLQVTVINSTESMENPDDHIGFRTTI